MNDSEFIALADKTLKSIEAMLERSAADLDFATLGIPASSKSNLPTAARSSSTATAPPRRSGLPPEAAASIFAGTGRTAGYARRQRTLGESRITRCRALLSARTAEPVPLMAS